MMICLYRSDGAPSWKLVVKMTKEMASAWPLELYLGERIIHDYFLWQAIYINYELTVDVF